MPVILGAILFALSSTAVDSAQVPLFSSLARGEEIQIKFESIGCFSGSTDVLTIVRDKRTKAILVESDFAPTRPRQTKGSDTRRGLAETKLTEAEIKGLDKLLAYYREPKQETCTTYEHVTFCHFRAGALVQKEKVTDATCALTSHRDRTDKSMFTIQELLARLR